MINPWLEPARAERIHEIRRDITVAARSLESIAKTHKKIGKEAEAFIEALHRVQEHLRHKPDDWRQMRPLFAVDLPAILGVAQSLDTVPEGPTRKRVIKSLNDALRAKRPDVSKLEARRAEELALSLDVLTEGPEVPVEEAAKEGRLMGWASGFGRKVKSLGSDAIDVVTETAEDVASGAMRTASAATGYVSYTGEVVGSALSDAGRAVTSPVLLRAQALTGAIAEIGVGAIAYGGFASVLFPPAAPFAIGIAALELPEAYSKRFATLSDEEAQEALRDEGAREDRLAQISAALRSGPVRIDTPRLSITLDPASGKTSGVILEGMFTGDLLERRTPEELEALLKFAPDDDTRRALKAWKAHHSVKAA